MRTNDHSGSRRWGWSTEVETHGQWLIGAPENRQSPTEVQLWTMKGTGARALRSASGHDPHPWGCRIANRWLYAVPTPPDPVLAR